MQPVELGALPPRQRRTVEAILDAAFDLYLEQGVTRTSLSELSRRAGISRPTIYKYFGDASGVTRAVVQREFETFFDGVPDWMQQQEAAAEGDREPIVELVVFAVRYARGHALFQRMLTAEPEIVLPLVTVRAAPTLRSATTVIVEALQSTRDRRNAAGNGAGGRGPHGEPTHSTDLQRDAEIIARTALSLVTTESVVVDLEDTEALRNYVTIQLNGVLRH